MLHHAVMRNARALPGLAALAVAAATMVSASAGTQQRFHMRHWTSEDGLPQNSVRHLLQSRDGYLWIGTSDGLARYDGMKFTVYRSELQIAQPAQCQVQDLCEDADGRIWIRTGHGLIAYDRGRFHAFSFVGKPALFAMRPCSRGGLWLTTEDGWHRFEGGRITQSFSNFHGLLPDRLDLGFEDRTGRLWLHGRGVGGAPGEGTWCRFDLQKNELVKLAQLFPDAGSDLFELAEDAAGRLWGARAGELVCCAAGRVERYPLGEQFAEVSIGRLTPDHRGGVWFHQSDYPGVFHWSDGELRRYGREQGLEARDIRCLLTDREGNVWVGSGDRGLIRLQPRRLTSLITTNSHGARNEVFSVKPGREDKLWFGTSSGLLFLRDGQTGAYTNSTPNIHNHFEQAVRPVLEDGAGVVWFGLSGQGLQRLSGGTFVRERAADLWQTEDWSVRALLEDQAGNLWVGTTHGLMVRRNGQFQIVHTTAGPCTYTICGLQMATDGALWVGTESHGLLRLKEGQVDTYTTTNGLLSDTAAPLLVEADGTLWAGTPNGLNRIRRGQIRAVTIREGLFDNIAYGLLDDGRGNYWSYCNRGIYRVRQADLHTVADGRTNRLHCVAYGEADGMASAEGNGDWQPGACRTADGRLWFPTTCGVVMVTPASLHENPVRPPVVIEEVIADDETILKDGSLTGPPKSEVRKLELKLPPGRARVLEIRYTANVFTAPEKVRFRYRLEGSDHDWREGGEHRVAYYTNLRPGEYQFQVLACNNDGYWSDQAAAFAFSLAPHLWQTWPFYAAAAALVLLAGFALHHQRVRGLRRIQRLEQQRAVEQERSRIARDLHDDLGASLTGVALQLEAAQRRGRAEGEQLAALAGETRSLAHELRELAWTTNPRCDNAGSLVAFIGEQAERFSEAAELECRLSLPGAEVSRAVPARVRHELLVVLKESFANIAKHAAARTVWVSLNLGDGEARLVVRDDGRGFDPVRATGGSGLRNLRERLQQLGGGFGVETQAGQGTTVSARLPLNNSNHT